MLYSHISPKSIKEHLGGGRFPYCSTTEAPVDARPGYEDFVAPWLLPLQAVVEDDAERLYFLPAASRRSTISGRLPACTRAASRPSRRSSRRRGRASSASSTRGRCWDRRRATPAGARARARGDCHAHRHAAPQGRVAAAPVLELVVRQLHGPLPAGDGAVVRLRVPRDAVDQQRVLHDDDDRRGQGRSALEPARRRLRVHPVGRAGRRSHADPLVPRARGGADLRGDPDDARRPLPLRDRRHLPGDRLRRRGAAPRVRGAARGERSHRREARRRAGRGGREGGARRARRRGDQLHAVAESKARGRGESLGTSSSSSRRRRGPRNGAPPSGRAWMPNSAPRTRATS